MNNEFLYFVSGLMLGLTPLLCLVAVKKFNLLSIRPNHKIVYRVIGSQRLALYAFMAHRRANEAPAPALLLFHGGRWQYGQPDELYPQCRYFAAQGFSCFSAQYRLGSSGQLDVRDAMSDAQAALQYLIEHSRELDIDPDKIIVGGGSAGAQLAAALGAGLSQEGDVCSSTKTPRPAAQILYNPMLDLSPGTPDHHLVKAYWQEISPCHHIDNAMPPTLILLGSQDPEVPLATAQAFCSAVQGAGGQCEIALYEGQGHGFYHQPNYRQQTNQRIQAFLKNLMQF